MGGLGRWLMIEVTAFEMKFFICANLPNIIEEGRFFLVKVISIKNY